MQKQEDEVKYELHEVEFTLTEPTYYTTILGRYIQECSEWCYFPTDERTSTGTVARGMQYPPVDRLTPTGADAGNTAIKNGVYAPYQWYINDLSYNEIRMRGNVPNAPAGAYKLKFYGIAKE